MLCKDVVVIGAGVIGSTVSRELSKYKINTLLIEKNSDVAFCNISKASNAWVHAGIGFPGKICNKLLVEGNEMLDKLCEELEIPFRRIGEIFIALNRKSEKVLEELKSQGLYNGVKGLRILKKGELFKIEPNLAKNIRAGLLAPLAGTISPWELIIAQVENAKENGIEVLLDTEVKNIQKYDKNKLIVETNKGNIITKFIINSAGLWVDTIAEMVKDNSFKITPRKGQLLITDKILKNMINNIIFDAELWVEPYEGGVIGPSVEGNIIITGPDEEIKSKIDPNNDRNTLEKMIKFAKRIVPSLSSKDIIKYFTGVRALNSLTDDFIIEASGKMPNLIHVQVSSPGITCCIPIAQHVIQLLQKAGLKLVKKSNFNPYRKSIPKISELSNKEKEKLIRRDPRYGHIVCRCEHISEGEIVEAIRRGARTLDGVKFRTRAGMGRCQGGFCSSRVLKILSRELDLPVTEITKKGRGSEVVLFKAKDLLIGKGVE